METPFLMHLPIFGAAVLRLTVDAAANLVLFQKKYYRFLNLVLRQSTTLNSASYLRHVLKTHRKGLLLILLCEKRVKLLIKKTYKI